MGSYNQRSPCGSQPSDMTYQNNSNHRDNLNWAQLLMSFNNAAESSIYLFIPLPKGRHVDRPKFRQRAKLGLFHVQILVRFIFRFFFHLFSCLGYQKLFVCLSVLFSLSYVPRVYKYRCLQWMHLGIYFTAPQLL